MLDTFTRMVILDIIIFMIYTLVVIPIHEVGHMIAFRHYGVKSFIGLGSYARGDGTKGKALAYCQSLFWADSLIFVEDAKKDAVVAFAGAGASIIFCLCMYVLFPLNGLLFAAFFEGMCGLAEVKESRVENERIKQDDDGKVWYIESKAEHEIFMEELSKSEYEGLALPQTKTHIRCMGFDLKEFG